MKKLNWILILIILISIETIGQIKVISLKGDIKFRQGVSENWLPLKINSVIKLEDAIYVGKKSQVTLHIDNEKKITIPEESIVEILDLRKLSKEDLLLKLAMDRILEVPQQERKSDLMPAPSAVIHGEKKSNTESNAQKANLDIAIKTLNGAKILFGNNFYGTCALRIREVLRMFPDLPNNTDYRIMIALALEKVGLYNEAIDELNTINFADLTEEQKVTVKNYIENIRKKIKD